MIKRGTWKSGARRAGLKDFFKRSSLYGHFKLRKGGYRIKSSKQRKKY